MDNKRQKNNDLEGVNVDITNENFERDSSDKKLRKKLLMFRSKRNIILTIVCLVLVATIYILWSSSVVFNGIVNSLYNSYQNEEKSYEYVMNKISLVDKFGDVEWAKEKCNALKNSRDAYRKAVNYENENDYINALIEYNKVIASDTYKDKANEGINSLKIKAYDDIINKLNIYLEEKKCNEAQLLIDCVTDLFPNDTKIDSFSKEFVEMKKILEFEKEIASCDLSTEDGIKHYVELKYATLKNTPFGDWNFTVNVHEFNDKSISLDYSVELFLDIDSSKFYDFIYSRDYSEDDRQKTEQMLKNHIITLAQDLIEKLPNKKLEGRYKVLRSIYNDSGEFVKVSRSDCYYEWTNYVYDINADYASSSPSGFRWKWTDPDAPWHYETFFYGGAK